MLTSTSTFLIDAKLLELWSGLTNRISSVWKICKYSEYCAVLGVCDNYPSEWEFVGLVLSDLKCRTLLSVHLYRPWFDGRNCRSQSVLYWERTKKYPLQAATRRYKPLQGATRLYKALQTATTIRGRLKTLQFCNQNSKSGRRENQFIHDKLERVIFVLKCAPRYSNFEETVTIFSPSHWRIPVLGNIYPIIRRSERSTQPLYRIAQNERMGLWYNVKSFFYC